MLFQADPVSQMPHGTHLLLGVDILANPAVLYATYNIEFASGMFANITMMLADSKHPLATKCCIARS